MKKIVGIAALLFAGTNFAFNQPELEDHLATMISVVKNEILHGDRFSIFGGDYELLPIILIEDKGKLFPNGNLTPIEEGALGVMINYPFLNMKDSNAQLFALAHEVGHGFSQKVLEDIGCEKVMGIASEVIADLGAVKILQSMGLSLDLIDSTVADWRKSMIFNVSKSGDHPAGADRYQIIRDFIVLLKAKSSFTNATKQIIRAKTDAECPK